MAVGATHPCVALVFGACLLTGCSLPIKILEDGHLGVSFRRHKIRFIDLFPTTHVVIVLSLSLSFCAYTVVH